MLGTVSAKPNIHISISVVWHYFRPCAEFPVTAAPNMKLLLNTPLFCCADSQHSNVKFQKQPGGRHSQMKILRLLDATTVESGERSAQQRNATDKDADIHMAHVILCDERRVVQLCVFP